MTTNTTAPAALFSAAELVEDLLGGLVDTEETIVEEVTVVAITPAQLAELADTLEPPISRRMIMDKLDLDAVALDAALRKLRTAAADQRPERVAELLRDEAAALLGLLDSAGRDVRALARILGMLEDREDSARAEFRAHRDRLHVPPGQTRPSIEWRRGRLGMARELHAAAGALARTAQREEVAPSE